ncbi:hypothetical protein [[Clostridium] fimetarium]|uniref:Uncharacterized protein n=1 Tax=[Clostridium] fimetarium TaxID=99656 RepID=A0A1I0MZA6_9FIRM|nr:hypothetical protein [[Clostridium] fimetarium]SEV93442.1 hypothetical protein SAMN05421659_102227 [[Clostridium] fimetarium]
MTKVKIKQCNLADSIINRFQNKRGNKVGNPATDSQNAKISEKWYTK